MHIQVINFNLNGLSETEYGALCDEIAPTFAEVPGLISKVWLANRSSNTFGGVYTWANRRGWLHRPSATRKLWPSVPRSPESSTVHASGVVK